MMRRNLPLPELNSILLLSCYLETYFWVCSMMLKCVVGCTTWNRRCYKEELSQVATESDESFLILTLENNFDRWMYEAKYATDDEALKRMPESKYTNSGTSKQLGKGSSRRFHGWSREGYLRFNALFYIVKADQANRAMFECNFKTKLEQDHKRSCSNEAVEDGDKEEEEIFPANDIPGMKQPFQKQAFPVDNQSDDDEDTVMIVTNQQLDDDNDSSDSDREW